MTRAPKVVLPKIKSAMASHAEYDPAAKALTVRFHNGDTFRYDGVPVNIGETLTGASSFGTQFQRHIAGSYKGKRL